MHHILENIECDTQQVAEQAFKMLTKWMQMDAESCYCKLITAMKEDGLSSEAEALKSMISSSKFLLLTMYVFLSFKV